MLFPFFQWCEASFVGQAIRNSLWLFPVIEAVHLLGLAVIGGAVLIVDLKLLGWGLRQPTHEVARDTRPWLVGSLIVMLVTGISLFLSESIKCYYSQAFWWKITALPLAILFTFTIKQYVVRKQDRDIRPLEARLVALVSMALWFTVGAGGRWIGFS
jgi:uncharacterized protein DUF6644